jgi:hypothetical protein
MAAHIKACRVYVWRGQVIVAPISVTKDDFGIAGSPTLLSEISPESLSETVQQALNAFREGIPAEPGLSAWRAGWPGRSTGADDEES